MKSLIFAVPLLALSFAACQNSATDDSVIPSVDSVDIDSSKISLWVGRNFQLGVEVYPDCFDPDSVVSWFSTDTTVARVEDGKVYALKKGVAHVIAVAEDKTDTCEVRIGQRASAVSVPSAKMVVGQGQRIPFKVKTTPATLPDSIVVWSSSDPTIADCVGGWVRGRKVGTVTLTAEVDGIMTQCEVTVKAAAHTRTDMTKLVDKKGGDTMGALRFSLVWNDVANNRDDLDAHCTEPTGNELCFNNKTSVSGGKLDVDNRYPQPSVTAVENITWKSISTMQKGGKYIFSVHRYADRGGRGGFRAELAIGGNVYRYSYDGNWSSKTKWHGASFSCVEVAEISVDSEGFVSVRHILPTGTYKGKASSAAPERNFYEKNAGRR